ncbi:hypothetical protein GH733_005797 [Mirounga leonina]|nr:hypothetical protein GH733_005797 [Mirounga leonina]
MAPTNTQFFGIRSKRAKEVVDPEQTLYRSALFKAKNRISDSSRADVVSSWLFLGNGCVPGPSSDCTRSSGFFDDV